MESCAPIYRPTSEMERTRKITPPSVVISMSVQEFSPKWPKMTKKSAFLCEKFFEWPPIHHTSPAIRSLLPTQV